MAKDAVWLDVLPSMAGFGSAILKGATAESTTADPAPTAADPSDDPLSTTIARQPVGKPASTPGRAAASSRQGSTTSTMGSTAGLSLLTPGTLRSRARG